MALKLCELPLWCFFQFWNLTDVATVNNLKDMCEDSSESFFFSNK